MQCACAILPSVACRTLRNVSTLSHKRHDFRERKSYLTQTVLNTDRPTDVTCFIISLFTAQHVSNVSTSIFRSLRIIVDLFRGMYCSGSMCVGVVSVAVPMGNVS